MLRVLTARTSSIRSPRRQKAGEGGKAGIALGVKDKGATPLDVTPSSLGSPTWAKVRTGLWSSALTHAGGRSLERGVGVGAPGSAPCLPDELNPQQTLSQ